MRYTEERYEDSLKAYRDMRNTLDNAKKEGFEEGLIKGERNKAMEIATKMKAKGFSVDDIVQMTGLSADEVKKIKTTPKNKLYTLLPKFREDDEQ